MSDPTSSCQTRWLRRVVPSPRILSGLAMFVLGATNAYWSLSPVSDSFRRRVLLRWLSTSTGGFVIESLWTLGSCRQLGMGLVLLLFGVVRLIVIADG